MEYPSLYHQLLIRLPGHSMNRFEEGWQTLLQCNQFIAALRLSSEDLYQELMKSSLQGKGELPLKMKRTLWKYANRMSYRSTPFGSFSGVGIWDWSNGQTTPLKSTDFITLEMSETWESQAEGFVVNPMAYRFGSGSRYYLSHQESNGN